MKFDNIKNVPCVGGKVVVPDPEDTDVIVPPLEPVEEVLEDCVPGEGDMEFAAIAGTSYCPNAPTIRELKVEPATGMEILELTGVAQYTASLYFEYTDSTVLYRKDVTKSATWKSSDVAVAVHTSGGSFAGKEVAANKDIKVRASYTPSAMVEGVRKTHSETFTASADLKVKQSCIDTAIDIVLVVDRSGSMLKTDEPGETAGKTRLEAARDACTALVENSKCYGEDDLATIVGDPNAALNTNRTADSDGKMREVDRIAIVTYAGIDRDYPAAEIHSPFNSTKTGVKDSILSIRVAYECGNEDTPSGLLHSEQAENAPEGCWTGMGRGLELAYELLQGDAYAADGFTNLPGTRSTSNTDPWPRKLIILLTDGYENVCSPDPEAIATSIRADISGSSGTKAHDTMIYAIGFMVNSTQSIRRCSGVTMTAESYMGLIANCYANSATSLTSFPQTAEDLNSVYTKLLALVCTDNLKTNVGNDKACHYIDNTGMSRVGGSAVKGLSVGYAYEQWTHWVVCKNTVDKMGVESFNNINPSAGQMVGLIGNQGNRLLSVLPGKFDEQLIVKEDVLASWKGKTCQIFYAPYDHNFGGIESRKPITFTKDTKYKLTLNLGGNLLATEGQFTHGIDVGSSVRITIGGTQQGILEGYKALSVPVYNSAGGPESSLAVVGGFPMLVTRNIISPLKVGSASKHSTGRADNGAEFVVNIHPEATIAAYDFEFTPSETADCVIRVEQYPDKYLAAVKNFTHKLTDKDVKSILDRTERATGVRPSCDIERNLNISWFSGFSSGFGDVYYDSNEEYRYETSCADEFLGPVPFGVVLSNVILTEGGTSIFTDNFAT